MATPFQLGNVCEDPERCEAFEEKGGDARESICPRCPVYTECQRRGFLSQPSSLRRAKTQILALPELFFNPQHADTADTILNELDDTERLCVIDRKQAYNLFLECILTKDLLQEWSTNWKGSALGNFAKALLHAVEIKDIPHAAAVKRIRAVINAFEWQQERLIKQMCKVSVWGKVVERGFVDPDSDKHLARFSIKFDDEALAYIPVDENAKEKLTALRESVFEFNRFALNEEIKILMPMAQAIDIGVFPVDTVEDIEKLPTTCLNENWTYLHQLKNFFSHYTRDADAPIRWTGKMLKFWVPPIIHPTVKRLMLLSETLSVEHLRRTFPDERIEVHRTEPSAWMPGSNLFQIRTGFYPQKAILDYNENLDFVGMSETGKRFFNSIFAEIEKEPNIKHAIITYESTVSLLSKFAKKDNVSFVTNFFTSKEFLTAYKEVDVVWIIGTPQPDHNLIWRRSQILFGNDKEPLSYEEDVDSGCYKDARVQSVFEQSAIPILRRVVQRVKLNRFPNKKIVLISSLKLPQITDRVETLLFDWEDFEIAGSLEKLAEAIAVREHYETERANLTSESGRAEVERILGCSSRQANRVLQKLRGGAPLRIPFREQILSLLADGEKRTAEFIEAIEGHPKAIKNELGRLVDNGVIAKVRWGVYTLPKA